MTTVLFVVIPLLALLLAIGGSGYRYLTARYTWSSLSSQMLENRRLFWGSVPWHYGIIPLLGAHLLAGLFPGLAAAVLADPRRLFVLEVAGLALGLYTLVGLGMLCWRRVAPASRARAVTSVMDWVLLVALGAQVVTGLGSALFLRWGSLWYLAAAAPWFSSLVTLSPNPSTLAPLPAVAQFHAVNGFVIIGLLPFTRLIHVVSVPLAFLWRPHQIVVWLGRRRSRGDAP
jgi:nitrate reductase gamma subunit